jgi:hypothetical protein
MQVEAAMKVLATAAVLLGCAAAQTPDIREIMTRVGENQEKAQDLRKQFTFRQRQLLRMNRGNGKLAREERREYDVAPAAHGVNKELVKFEGRYERNGKYIAYDRPGYEYKGMDIDGELINGLSEDMTNSKNSRDGIDHNLFPLTSSEQRKYNFKLAGTQTHRGRQVYRVSFEPKPHQDFDEAGWKGEALIDAAAYQPVLVNTNLALKLPLFVKTLLGTNIKGLGFSVAYQKFEDGIWFPVSYGGEFEVRAVFFYKRTISVSMGNSDFRRTSVNSNVSYVTETR